MKKFPFGCLFTLLVIGLLFSILVPALHKASEGVITPLHRLYMQELKEIFEHDGKLPETITFDNNKIFYYFPENWGKANKVFVFYRKNLPFWHEKYIIGLGNGDSIIVDEYVSLETIFDIFDLTFKQNQEDKTSTTEETKYLGNGIYLR